MGDIPVKPNTLAPLTLTSTDCFFQRGLQKAPRLFFCVFLRCSGHPDSVGVLTEVVSGPIKSNVSANRTTSNESSKIDWWEIRSSWFEAFHRMSVKPWGPVVDLYSCVSSRWIRSFSAPERRSRCVSSSTPCWRITSRTGRTARPRDSTRTFWSRESSHVHTLYTTRGADVRFRGVEGHSCCPLLWFFAWRLRD